MRANTWPPISLSPRRVPEFCFTVLSLALAASSMLRALYLGVLVLPCSHGAIPAHFLWSPLLCGARRPLLVLGGDLQELADCCSSSRPALLPALTRRQTPVPVALLPGQRDLLPAPMISHIPPSLKATPLHTGVPPLRGTSLTASAGICFWAVRHALRSCFLLSPCQSHRRPLFW